jgi:prepilin-type N-terminal cleavage/methylation domain-containing protein
MTRHRTGFTLIEMLVVVVVIGILAAIAIPKFSHAKARTRAAAIRSDLRNLATAQEEYLSEHGFYASDPAVLPYTNSEGVVVTVTAVVGGWSATTSHAMGDPGMCALFYGTAPAVAPATKEGVIACASTVAATP